MSLLLDSGEAFVGDLAMSGFPKMIGKGMPVFAEDVVAVKESWRLLLSRGARLKVRVRPSALLLVQVSPGKFYHHLMSSV